jgi:hypothetical protein
MGLVTPLFTNNFEALLDILLFVFGSKEQRYCHSIRFGDTGGITLQ